MRSEASAISEQRRPRLHEVHVGRSHRVQGLESGLVLVELGASRRRASIVF